MKNIIKFIKNNSATKPLNISTLICLLPQVNNTPVNSTEKKKKKTPFEWVRVINNHLNAT